MTVGERVLECAKNAGITQSELAEQLGINQASVSLWGKNGSPRLDKIPELSAILGVSVEYLLTGASVVPFPAGLSAPASASSPSAPLSSEVDRLRSELSRSAQTIDSLNGYIALLEEKLAAAGSGRPRMAAPADAAPGRPPPSGCG